MTILWAGNEDVDFLGSVCDTSNVVIGANDFARVGIKTANKAASATFTPGTSLWLSYYSVKSTFIENVDVSLRCSATESCIGFGYSDTDLVGFTLFTNDDDTYNILAVEENNSLGDPGDLNKIDICVTNYGTNGSVTCYVNSYQRISFNGDLVQGPGGNIDQVVIDISGDHQMFGFIVATEDTRDMMLKTLAPNAAGSYSDWNGTYANINELALSAVNLIGTDTLDLNFQCNLTGMPTGDFTVEAVVIAYQGIKGLNGIRMKHGLNIGGTTVLKDPIDQNSYYTCTNKVYLINPNTEVDFTPSEIESLQLAFQSVY
jgi:hypothetical protein